MRTKASMLAAILATFLAGCAATDSATSVVPPQEREYVTGSRIPVRDPSRTMGDVKVIDRESLERAGQTEVNTSSPSGK